MPLERSIEVCISLNIKLDSLFLIQCWRSRLKAVIYFWGEPKESLSWSQLAVYKLASLFTMFFRVVVVILDSNSRVTI